MTTFYPIARVAEMLAVDERAVKALIKTGALPASDVSPPGSKYRKWRIAESDLELFLARRAHTPAAAVTRRRRRTDLGIIHFDYS